MKNNKKSILFVINDFNVGGAEVFVLRFGIALQTKYNVYITDLSPHKKDSNFKGQFLDAGFNYLPNKFQFSKISEWFYWKLNAVFSLLGIKSFYDTIKQKKQGFYWLNQFKKHDIKIVNSHLIASDEFVYKTIYPLKDEVTFKWVITMHSSYNPLHYQFKNHLDKEKFFEKVKAIMNASDSIVGVAQENFSIFKEVKINKQPQKIYLGFTPKNQSFFDQSNDKIKLLMIGRGIEEKGWEIAIKAFEKLHLKHKNIELYLVGPLTEYMLNLKNKYSNASIFFEGYQSDPTKYYLQAFVTILPSYGESLPYTVIESLGYRVPVIVSNRGEMGEMIQTNGAYAGALIKDDENTNLPSIESLEVEIENLIIDSAYYEKLKMNTSYVFEKFSIEYCVKEYEKLFS